MGLWFLQPGISVTDVIMRVLAVLVIVLAVLPLHECAHGWVAEKLGDNTAKYSGRLTLNPLPHIDPIGALCILLFGFGWAKPVPVNSRNFKNPKAGMAVTALAGPVSNLLAAIVGGILLNLVLVIWGGALTGVLYWVYLFFSYYISINVGLAAFNLIPIPPLDGSKILAAFLPNKALYKFYQYQNIFAVVMLLLLWVGVLDVPLSFLQNVFFDAVVWVAKLPFLPFI